MLISAGSDVLIVLRAERQGFGDTDQRLPALPSTRAPEVRIEEQNE